MSNESRDGNRKKKKKTQEVKTLCCKWIKPLLRSSRDLI